MSTYMYKTKDQNPIDAVKTVLSAMLAKSQVDAVFVAARTPYAKLPMPALITSADKMDDVDPLAPAAPLNAARQASSILKYETGKKIALVLRPCEERALIELVKLNQCDIGNAVIIGMTCMGRMENGTYLKCLDDHEDLSISFYVKPDLQAHITTTCKSCDKFLSPNADITIDVTGMKDGIIGFLPQSEKGETLLSGLYLAREKTSTYREKTIEDMLKTRQKEKEQVMKAAKALLNPLENFQKTVATCLNCYNCRTACPVCYCKECVFLTDIFAHKPEVLFQRAKKKGAIKLPQDTSMFHLTRLSHMAHACVGCGHCSSVCPSGIPVADMFRAVAEEVQRLYQYEPGKDMHERPPYIAYREKNTFIEQGEDR
ncbi:MAG: 4Fe-4S dicluster domain-containing protein [Proteobacteria bacterium]|nr:4Fe-4S dicluster domain-containing protein [Pseudomonadota bacterium]